MIASNGKLTISVGDRIKVRAQGITVEGTVHTVAYWEGDGGWYIEMLDANVPGGYSYWKQGVDGGHIEEVNGIPIY